jgi:radical SAM superfamily enzyme YgiQ (UPF0313 family)
MKITLVNPPSLKLKYEPPLGLASLGAFLLEHNIETKILDAEALGLSHAEIYNALKKDAPDFVGVSVFTFNRFSAFEVAEAAKKIGAKVVVGGPHVSFTSSETLSDISSIDFVVMGEGEVSLYQLLKAHMDNSPLEEIAGIAFRNQKGVIINKSRPLVTNLDELPDPAFHLLPMDEYPFHAVMGARGCPNCCTFCASPFLWNRQLRFLSPTRFIHQLKHLLNTYGNKPVHFKDDTFTCHIKRAKEICEQIIGENLNINWDCLARVHPINEELFNLMKQAGCDKIRFGIEAGNEEILKKIKKNITKTQIRHALDISKRVNFKSVGTLFMVGHPGETIKELEETLALSCELRADHVGFAPTMIFPGTELYEIAKNTGVLAKNFSWNKKGLYKAGFENLTPDDVPLFSTETLSSGDLAKIAKRFYAESFFTRVFDCSSTRDIRYLFETGLGVSFAKEENKQIIIDAFKLNLKKQRPFYKKLWGFILLFFYLIRSQNIQRNNLLPFIKKFFRR